VNNGTDSSGDQKEESHSKSVAGPVAGGVVGGVVLVLAIIAVFIFVRRRRSGPKQQGITVDPFSAEDTETSPSEPVSPTRREKLRLEVPNGSDAGARSLHTSASASDVRSHSTVDEIVRLVTERIHRNNAPESFAPPPAYSDGGAL
jgi:hypothetical protein